MNVEETAALQRVIYDDETEPADILAITAAPDGFGVDLTLPLGPEVSVESLEGRIAVESWFYTNLPRYGSPENDKRTDALEGVVISPDRRSVRVKLRGFGDGDGWTDRVYHLKLDHADSLFGKAPGWKTLEGYYTLRAVPGK